MPTLDCLNIQDELLLSLPNPLKDIGKKVIEQQRLSFEEGLFLFNFPEDEPIRLMADYARQIKVGNTVYFSTTLYIHPTNLCELSCQMCSFYAKPGWKKAWFLTPTQIEEQVKTFLPKGLKEIHIVGGLWRECDLAYYRETFSLIKALDPRLHIKALTPVEYDFIAQQENLSIEKVLQTFKDFGLDSLPGGGAEILVEEIRKKIAPQKISSEQFLSIHEVAHRLKIPSNITMLFDHIETYEHILIHLIKIRSLQDETKGFVTFVPLKYHEENNALGKRKNRLQSKKNIRRVFAVSRLMLDNIPNIKSLWNYLGVELAQELLNWGANDLSATQLEEKIIKMAGGTQDKMDRTIMTRLITEKNRVPLETHSTNRP